MKVSTDSLLHYGGVHNERADNVAIFERGAWSMEVEVRGSKQSHRFIQSLSQETEENTKKMKKDINKWKNY